MKKSNLAQAKKKKHIVFAVVLLAVAVFLGFRQLLVNSDAFQIALRVAEENPALQEQIGYPIKHDFLVMGQVELTGSGWHAELEIPLTGSKGSGVLIGDGRKDGKSGMWFFDKLFIVLENGRELNLLDRDMDASTE